MTLDEHKAVMAETIAVGAEVHRKPADVARVLQRYIRAHGLPLVVTVTDGVVAVMDAESE